MLTNKRFLAERLARRFGVNVEVGLYSWLEDIRDPKTGEVVQQIRHDDGEKFVREDGVPISQADIDADTPLAEADEAAALQAAADRAARRTTLDGEAVSDNFIDALRSATPTQIKNFVNTNVADLPTARALLARLAVAVAYALNGGQAK